MNNLKQIEKLRKMHAMIKLETTGSPRVMAKKMHVSERQLYNLIDQLRTMDAPIRFNRSSNTYYYTHDFELLVNISVKVIQGDEVLQIYAGQRTNHNFRSLQGLCRRETYLGHVMTVVS
ncbi:MAG: DNA-binding protein [Lutimonas sp.]